MSGVCYFQRRLNPETKVFCCVTIYTLVGLNQQYVLRWTEISSNSPLKIFFDCFFFIKLFQFFEVWEKNHGISVLSY